jgi:integrase
MPAPARKVSLTDRSLKALRKPDPDGKRVIVWDAIMPSFAVRVSAKGKVGYYAVRRPKGSTTLAWILLGHYPAMGLGDARKAVAATLAVLESGQHPKKLEQERRRSEEKAKREAEGNSFEAIADKFTRQYLPRMRPNSRRLYELYLRRELIPQLGHKPVAEIRRRDVIGLVEKIETNSGKASALGALSCLRKVLNWALQRDIPGFEANPAAAIRTLDLLGPSKSRDRLLSDAELAAIWRAFPQVGEPFASIYKLLTLTGARLREIAAAKWPEVNLDAATLTVEAERTKNGDTLIIPLPPLAVELLRSVPRLSGPYVFGFATAGQRPPGALSAAKARLDAAITAAQVAMPAFVIHDLRRTVRSNLGRLGIPANIAELTIGHKQGNTLIQTYDRWAYLDERRQALQRWERFLLSIVEPTPEGGNVLMMPARVVPA